MPGDRVVEHIVRTLPQHLTPGGTGQVLANWAIVADQPWDERLAGWLAPGGCDAWVVQREVLDLPSYVELWLKDAGLHPSTGSGQAAEYYGRYDTWLSWFSEQGIEAVGFGWITLRASGSAAPDLRLEEWRWEVEQPLGPENDAHFARVSRVRDLSDEALLAARPVRRPDVVQETHGPVGAEDPSQIVLRQQRGMRRGRQVDTVAAALAGAADGELTVGQLLGAIGQLVGEVDVPARIAEVRDLLTEGFLELDTPAS
jgi:hypothetical protein